MISVPHQYLVTSTMFGLLQKPYRIDKFFKFVAPLPRTLGQGAIPDHGKRRSFDLGSPPVHNDLMATMFSLLQKLRKSFINSSHFLPSTRTMSQGVIPVYQRNKLVHYISNFFTLYLFCQDFGPRSYPRSWARTFP